MEEGAPCNVDLDDIDDVIERARDFLSDINARDALSDVIDAVLPCRSGLVCRRVSVDSRVCMPEAAGQLFNHSSLHAAIYISQKG